MTQPSDLAPPAPRPSHPVIFGHLELDEGEFPQSEDAWDTVDQASWESFPSSDSPGWRERRREPDEEDKGEAHAA